MAAGAPEHVEENRLVEFAEGLLGEVANHLDGCVSCRLVLAGIAQAATVRRAEGAARASAVLAGEAQPLREVLRAALAADAPHRERIALKLIFGCALFGIALWLLLPLGGVRQMRAPSIAFLAVVYSVVLQLLMRRGWYHRAVAWSNSCWRRRFPAS